MKAGSANQKAAEDCRTPKPGDNSNTFLAINRPPIGSLWSSPRIASAFIYTLFVVFTHSLRAELPVARLTSIFPPGAQTGSTTEVTVAGIDLDDLTGLVFSHTNITATTNKSSSTTFLVTVASNVPPGIYDARITGRYGISNPRAFAIGDQR